eukprot:5567822-Pleurochrysis_carterae.AAC.1
MFKGPPIRAAQGGLRCCGDACPCHACPCLVNICLLKPKASCAHWYRQAIDLRSPSGAKFPCWLQLRLSASTGKDLCKLYLMSALTCSLSLSP